MTDPSKIDNSRFISIIIPCYNNANYLAEAINSVLEQNYQNIEIIVVDDGSKDNPKNITDNYPSIKYFFQTNKGPSAARNTGIKHSRGQFLVFLDADDRLLKDALSINLNYLIENKKAAFVSGAYIFFYQKENKSWEMKREIDTDHYRHLLEGNYIGIHSSVMYQRWIFDDFCFDEKLKGSEDYDLFLKIARKHSILHHTELVAFYRVHDTNVTSNIPFMFETALEVLSKQKKLIKDIEEENSLKTGFYFLNKYYSEKIYNKLFNTLYGTPKTLDKKDIKILKFTNKFLYDKFIKEKRLQLKEKRLQLIKSYIRKFIPC